MSVMKRIGYWCRPFTCGAANNRIANCELVVLYHILEPLPITVVYDLTRQNRHSRADQVSGCIRDNKIGVDMRQVLKIAEERIALCRNDVMVQSTPGKLRQQSSGIPDELFCARSSDLG